MATYIDSCAAKDTIVITTRSNIYELVVLRGDRGDVLVRGGRHFTEVTAVLFLGSLTDDGSVERHTIRLGLRMKFVCGNRFVITPPRAVGVLSQRRRRTGVRISPVKLSFLESRAAH